MHVPLIKCDALLVAVRIGADTAPAAAHNSGCAAGCGARRSDSGWQRAGASGVASARGAPPESARAAHAPAALIRAANPAGARA